MITGFSIESKRVDIWLYNLHPHRLGFDFVCRVQHCTHFTFQWEPERAWVHSAAMALVMRCTALNSTIYGIIQTCWKHWAHFATREHIFHLLKRCSGLVQQVEEQNGPNHSYTANFLAVPTDQVVFLMKDAPS